MLRVERSQFNAAYAHRIFSNPRVADRCDSARRGSVLPGQAPSRSPQRQRGGSPLIQQTVISSSVRNAR